jgi:hypothetical protein
MTDQDTTIRIAVCQLECHPAIIVGDRDYLKEPFLPQKGQPTLADLSRHALDVSTLQGDCEKQYTDWHSHRLRHVLDWLSSISPIPDIIVFPECSILHPPNNLRQFSSTLRENPFY